VTVILYLRAKLNLQVMFLVCSGWTSVIRYQTSQLTQGVKRVRTHQIMSDASESRGILRHAALVVLMTEKTIT
jgi:hypothetical protein